MFTGIRVIYVRWKLIKSDLGQYSGNRFPSYRLSVLKRLAWTMCHGWKIQQRDSLPRHPRDPAKSHNRKHSLLPPPLIFSLGKNSSLHVASISLITRDKEGDSGRKPFNRKETLDRTEGISFDEQLLPTLPRSRVVLLPMKENEGCLKGARESPRKGVESKHE